MAEFGNPDVIQEEVDILMIGGGMACCGAAYEVMRWADAAKAEQGVDLKIKLVDKAAMDRSGAVAQGLAAINTYIGTEQDPADYTRMVANDLMGITRDDLAYDVGRHVDDLPAEDRDQVVDLRELGRRALHPDQREVAGDRVDVGHVADLDHRHQLPQVRLDEVGRDPVGLDDDRHPGDPLLLAAADREAVDVERAPAKEADDAVEDAGLVLDLADERVSHAGTSVFGRFGRRIISCRSAPAGTIG